MKTPVAAIGFALVSPLLIAADTRATCEQTFETKLKPGSDLRVLLRPGDIQITGSNTDMLKVSCELEDAGRARDVLISFRPEGHSAELRLSGGPKNQTRFHIEVPRRTNLFVRLPAGDLKLSGVDGDKDVELHAGDLTISVGDAGDYAEADGSVRAGDINAPAFGVNKGGLFRSFKQSNPGGKHRLHAHVGAGDLTLE
jgi:hypothetical protein